MKTPQTVTEEVRRRLQRTWAQTLVAEISPSPGGHGSAWPHQFTTGARASGAIARDFASTIENVAAWRDWATLNGLQIREQERRIDRVGHSIPSHVLVPDIDAAAAVAGTEWQDRIERGRQRIVEIVQRFPQVEDPARVLAAADKISDVDFGLLLRAGAWFATNTAEGLTPRQVPLEGFHAKWLNTSQGLVATLAGRDDLQLVRNHPPRIHFTYLDPDHLRTGARRHDSATVGDTSEPAYRPRVVVISENKDTAINFPELAGGISVEGVGRGGSTVAAFDWIRDAEAVIYWGDMDADGLEILDGFRAAGIPACSIFMDRAAYQRWEAYGTNTDARGTPLAARPRQATSHLTAAERALYEDLTASEWPRVRRIEQERIPLSTARAAVLAVTLSQGAVAPPTSA